RRVVTVVWSGMAAWEPLSGGFRSIVAPDGGDGVLPAAEGGGAPGGVAPGGEGLAAGLEQIGGGLGVGPEADAQAGEQRGAQRGRLGLRAATQRQAEQVGLELE